MTSEQEARRIAGEIIIEVLQAVRNGKDANEFVADRIATALADARREEREECAKVCEAKAKEFLDPEYAVNQPVGSVSERFACGQCANAIRARGDQ